MKKVLEHGILEFYDTYVISIVNEGVHITEKISQIIINETLAYFNDKPFVYIAYRIHSYTVDPEVFHKVSTIKTLAGFVAVTDEKPSIRSAIYEKIFLDKPFQVFSNLEDAIFWANSIIN